MLKTVSSIANYIGALNYKGTWNASTNTPTLVSGVGLKGDYYVVSVAGSTNLDGQTLWGVGDLACFNGSVWQKIDGGDTSIISGLTVTTLTGYMYSNNTAGVTASTTIPVANVSGAVANTINVLAGGLLSGGGALTSNVTISLASVPVANVTGLGTIATQNANAVAITGGTVTATLSGNLTSANVTITGGTINSVAFTNGTFANANITSVAVAFPNTFLANSTATLGNATITLGSATTTVGNLTLTNANIASVSATFPNSYFANSTTTLGNATLTLGSTTSTVGNLTLSNVTISTGTINVETTNHTATTSASATFATSSLPLVPAGYINFDLNGTVVKIPYYAV